MTQPIKQIQLTEKEYQAVLKFRKKEEQRIKQKQRNAELKKKKKFGYLKHDIYLLRHGYANGLQINVPLSEAQKDESIKSLMGKFELIMKAGAKVAYNYRYKGWILTNHPYHQNDVWANDNLYDIQEIVSK